MGSENEDWHFFTWKARIIPTVSGTASLLFSVLGISIILRSSYRDTSETLSHPTRGSAASSMSPYHRIMCFMFFWDIVSSVAIAMTVLPMPADVQETYPFPGKAYGNATTCAIQGLTIAGGQFFALYANCMLNVYYVCTLGYGISIEKINRRMLPIMFTISVLISFPVLIPIYYLGLFNPRRHEPYCYIGAYPESCNSPGSKVECIGKFVPQKTEYLVQSVFMFLFGFALLLVVVSMIIVVITAFKAELQQIETEAIIFHDGKHGNGMNVDTNSNATPTGHSEDKNRDNNPSVSDTNKKKKFKRTRTVVVVASMYIFAFLITWIWTIISVSAFITNWLYFLSQASWDLIGDLRLFFTPCQGVFNCLIFICNKAADIRNISPKHMSFCDAVWIVITVPATIPEVIITRIEMVDNDLVYRDNGAGAEGGAGAGAGAGVAPLEDFDDFELSDIDTPDLNHSHALSRAGMYDDAFDRKEDCGNVINEPTRMYYSNNIEYFQRRSSDRFSRGSRSGGMSQANSVQLSSSDKMETSSNINSSDLLSHDESRNRMGSFGMSSLLSGFSSVLTPPQYKKGGELEA